MGASGLPPVPEASLRPPGQEDVLPLETLGAELARQGLTLDQGAAPRRFAGGLANRNYLLVIDGRYAVLRCPPEGELPPGAHDMAREHRILSRLWRVTPLAPRGLLLCEDRSVIGVPFQLIEYRPGLVIRGTDLSAVGESASVGERLGALLVDTLAELHAIDPEAAGLGDLGRPEGFLGRAVAGWIGRCERLVEGGLAGATAEVAAWLKREPPSPSRAALLHNDFKLDNLILDPASLVPRAVVDWDQGTRGDPLFDLATLLSYWTEAGDPDCMRRLAQMPTAAPGFMTRQQAAERYARATGADLSGFRFHRVLAVFKLAVVFQQLHALFRAGRTADPRYAAFGALAEELFAFAHEIAQARLF